MIKMLNTLHQPELRLYQTMTALFSSQMRKQTCGGEVVVQDGNQFASSENRKICAPSPPLHVFPNIQCYDLEMVAPYKEEANANGMSISEYLSCCEFPMGECHIPKN
jgi:hypothetical protein